MPRPARIKIFKWGYEGWGNATRVLVRRVDGIERAAGYEPPMFVDIRFSRSVRATGFRDKAFEQQLGHTRYWRGVLPSHAGREAPRTRSPCSQRSHRDRRMARRRTLADRSHAARE